MCRLRIDYKIFVNIDTFVLKLLELIIEDMLQNGNLCVLFIWTIVAQINKSNKVAEKKWTTK